jgi:ABC-type multidrug transport system fused ATPase/permease subunit
MFVMEAGIPLVTSNPFELLIAKIPWYIFVIVLLIFIFMGIILFILGKQRMMYKKHRLEAKGNVVLEVLPTTGGNVPIEFALCKYHKGETRTKEDTSSATFTIPAWADAPPGHAIDRYLLPDEFDYHMDWPIWAPAIEQCTVPVYIVHKNFQFPECPHDAKKWDEKRRIEVSASMNALSKQESTLQMLMSPQMAFAEILQKIYDMLKKWGMIVLICAAAAAILSLISTGSNIFYVGDKIAAIAKFLTGK